MNTHMMHITAYPKVFKTTNQSMYGYCYDFNDLTYTNT
jgi:hypothetical protein